MKPTSSNHLKYYCNKYILISHFKKNTCWFTQLSNQSCVSNAVHKIIRMKCSSSRVTGREPGVAAAVSHRLTWYPFWYSSLVSTDVKCTCLSSCKLPIGWCNPEIILTEGLFSVYSCVNSRHCCARTWKAAVSETLHQQPRYHQSHEDQLVSEHYWSFWSLSALKSSVWADWFIVRVTIYWLKLGKKSYI